MSKEKNVDRETRTPSLASLHQERAALERRFDEDNRYLNEFAAHFSSSEEQRRIMRDIEDLRQAMARIDETMATLTRAASGN